MRKNLEHLKNVPGGYILVIELLSPLIVTTKRFKWELNPGFYFYFGSAFGKTSTSLGYRLTRHLTKKKKKLWHIDHLTSYSNTDIIHILYHTKTDLSECDLMQEFLISYKTGIIIPNFGSSDCKASCGGHLIYIARDDSKISKLVSYFVSKHLLTLKKRNDYSNESK
jgi:Uri superfamily endonuclease